MCHYNLTFAWTQRCARQSSFVTLASIGTIFFIATTFQQFLARHSNHPKCCPVWFPIIFLCSNFPPPVFWARYLVCLVHNSKTGPKHDHLDMLPFLYVRVTLPWLVEWHHTGVTSGKTFQNVLCSRSPVGHDDYKMLQYT